MKETYHALLNSGQFITEKKLINFFIDSLGPEFDLVVVHLSSKLNSVYNDITLAKANSLLQKYEQWLSRNYVYFFYVITEQQTLLIGFLSVCQMLAQVVLVIGIEVLCLIL